MKLNSTNATSGIKRGAHADRPERARCNSQGQRPWDVTPLIFSQPHRGSLGADERAESRYSWCMARRCLESEVGEVSTLSAPRWGLRRVNREADQGLCPWLSRRRTFGAQERTVPSRDRSRFARRRCATDHAHPRIIGGPWSPTTVGDTRPTIVDHTLPAIDGVHADRPERARCNSQGQRPWDVTPLIFSQPHRATP